MKALPASVLPASTELPARTSLPQLTTMIALFAALVCSGITSCTKTQVALSSAGLAAAVVGITVGVTLGVQHHKHSLQGCVSSGANGLNLRTVDAQIFALKGEDAGIKAGDLVKLHGLKEKKPRGSGAGDRVFLVQRLNKDYGPCPANFAAALSPTR